MAKKSSFITSQFILSLPLGKVWFRIYSFCHSHFTWNQYLGFWKSTIAIWNFWVSKVRFWWFFLQFLGTDFALNSDAIVVRCLLFTLRTQCGNLGIFLPSRFYVNGVDHSKVWEFDDFPATNFAWIDSLKSFLMILEAQKEHFSWNRTHTGIIQDWCTKKTS